MARKIYRGLSLLPKLEILDKKMASGSAVVNFLNSNNMVEFVKQVENDYVFKIKY